MADKRAFLVYLYFNTFLSGISALYAPLISELAYAEKYYKQQGHLHGHNRNSIKFIKISERKLDTLADQETVTTFTLHTRELTDGVKVERAEDLTNTTFDSAKPTKIVTHGWMSSGKEQTCLGIRDGFLKAYDANVFILDWSPKADLLSYQISSRSVPDIAGVLTKFLDGLFTIAGVRPADVHLVGHSLGAHLVGIAGQRFLTPKIGRVTGLDPAKPLYDPESAQKISKDSAEFVDVIHTCAGELGLSEALGHADFYPNGGTLDQPGCIGISVVKDYCAHKRSWEYFMESLQYPDSPFYALACDSYETFLKGECDKQVAPVKMGDPTPTTTTGTYYLRTAAESPYSLGLEGLHV